MTPPTLASTGHEQSDRTAIRHPKRGKAHRPLMWGSSIAGVLPRGLRVTGTACGYGNGATVRAMTEHIDIERVDQHDRCKRCWSDYEQARQG